MSQRQIFRVTDLSGGLNLDRDPSLLEENEATEILNFSLHKQGSLTSRKGYTKVVTAAAADDILSIGRWRDVSDSSIYHILGALTDGKIVRFNTATNAVTTLSTVSTTNAEGMFLPVEEYMIYVNGEDSPLLYNGTLVTTLSMTPPAAAPTTALDATGTGLTGEYKYRYTYFNSTTGWESNPSAESIALTAADDEIDVSVVESTHPLVSNIRIWRTLAGGSVYLLLTTIANTTAVYADSTPDLSLTALALRYDNTAALKYENIAYHKGYLFGSIGDTLYWSNPLNPSAWPTTFQTSVPFEGNDTIVALKSYEDTLLIFGSTNTILLAGQGGQWALNRQDVEIGAASRKAITEVDASLVFLSHKGMYVFPGFERFASKLESTINESPRASRELASLVYVKEERSLWLSLGSLTYSVHIPNQGVSVYTFYGHQYLQGGEDGYSPPIWIESLGTTQLPRDYLYSYEGTTDNGAAIPFTWESKVFLLTNPEFVKFFRRVGVFGTSGSEGVITFSIVDRDSSYSSIITSSGQLSESRWDAALWDTGTWVSDSLLYFIGALPANTLVGRAMKLALSVQSSSSISFSPPISIEFRESDRFIG